MCKEKNYDSVNIQLNQIKKNIEWQYLFEIIDINDIDNYSEEIISNIVFIGGKYIDYLCKNISNINATNRNKRELNDKELREIKEDINTIEKIITAIEACHNRYIAIANRNFTFESSYAYFYYNLYVNNSLRPIKTIRAFRVNSEIINKAIKKAYDIASASYESLTSDSSVFRFADCYRKCKLEHSFLKNLKRTLYKRISSEEEKQLRLEAILEYCKVLFNDLRLAINGYNTSLDEEKRKRYEKEYYKLGYIAVDYKLMLAHTYLLAKNIKDYERSMDEALKLMNRLLEYLGIPKPMDLTDELIKDLAYNQKSDKYYFGNQIYDIYYKYAKIFASRFIDRENYSRMFKGIGPEDQRRQFEEAVVSLTKVCDIKIALYDIKALQRGGFTHEISEMFSLLYYAKCDLEVANNYQKIYKDKGIGKAFDLDCMKEYYSAMSCIYYKNESRDKAKAILSQLAKRKGGNCYIKKAQERLNDWDNIIKNKEKNYVVFL